MRKFFEQFKFCQDAVKNNPLLVGQAGVGKTAIAQGLAKKIVDGQVPEILKNTTIYSLDVGVFNCRYKVSRRF